MRLAGAGARGAGGASGLGAATAEALVARDGRAAIVGRDGGRARGLAERLSAAGAGSARSAAAARPERPEETGAGERMPPIPAPALGLEADVTDEQQVAAAVRDAAEALGELRLVVSCAGIGWAERTVGRERAAALA